MEPNLLPIPAGSLLTVRTGEYSDYYVRGIFRALRDIDAAKLREEYLSERPKQRERYHFEDDEFLAWAVRGGYIEPVDGLEWHLSDYSDAAVMSVERHK